MTRNAVAQITSPVSGDVFRIGEPIPIQVALTGFSSPSFSMTVNGVAATSAWLPQEGVGRYGSVIPVTMIPQEGIYELNITVTENGLVRTVPFTLNVYEQRAGIFVDHAPTQYDLESGSKRVEAVVMGLAGVDSIRWRTDTALEPVGTGAVLELANAALLPGDRSITVEALAGAQVISSYTFMLKVLGPMRIELKPEDEPLIIQRGAQVTLTALARNRDGSPIMGGAITWTSHLDGLVGIGATLPLEKLTTITAGEHIFTVEATGNNGATVFALKRIQINAIEDDTTGERDDSAAEGDDQEGSQGGRPGQGPPGGSSFDQGNPMGQGGTKKQGTFGPGGAPPDPGLDDAMNQWKKNK
jgi:hypothetical protein